MAEPDPSPDSGSNLGQMLILGEIKGQLRELIHSINNVAQQQSAMGLRIAKLEEKEFRRDGAGNLLQIILKSPAIGWLVGAAISAWAVLTGKIHV